MDMSTDSLLSTIFGYLLTLSAVFKPMVFGLHGAYRHLKLERFD